MRGESQLKDEKSIEDRCLVHVLCNRRRTPWCPPFGLHLMFIEPRGVALRAQATDRPMDQLEWWSLKPQPTTQLINLGPKAIGENCTIM